MIAVNERSRTSLLETTLEGRFVVFFIGYSSRVSAETFSGYPVAAPRRAIQCRPKTDRQGNEADALCRRMDSARPKRQPVAALLRTSNRAVLWPRTILLYQVSCSFLGSC